MKKIILTILTILAGFKANAENKCLTSNGYITTNVEASAKASFLHTTQHHWKFEFWKGAVCWGKPDQHHQDNQDFKQSSDQCQGNINFRTNRGNQVNYTPVSLSWGANLTDGDTFTINLTDERVAAVYETSKSKCTTHKYGTKLEYASMTYETKAVINVPEDVWIVQVRATSDVSKGSDINELKPKIGRQVLKKSENPTEFFQSLSADEWTYLYVEPGEALELALSYANQGNAGSKKFDIRYDFKFIGHNRCTEVLGDPSRVNYSPEYLQKVIGSEIKSEADYHNYAIKLGCLRNPVFLKAAMNGSRPDSLVPALKEINKRTEQVISGYIKNERGGKAPFMATILDMTLVDVSRFALQDLSNYCKSYKEFTRETAVNNSVKQIAGIEFMMLNYSHFEMMFSQLTRKSLEVLVNNIESWSKNKMTYNQLFDGNKDAQVALKAYRQAAVQMGLGIYSEMHREFLNRIPKVEISKNHYNEILENLDAAATIADAVDMSITQMLRDFGNRSSDVISSQELSAHVRQLIDMDEKLQKQIRKYFEWFISSSSGGDNGDRFVETLVNLQTGILEPSAINLSKIAEIESLKSLNTKFVRRGELNQLNQVITKCIFNPYGGSN